MAFNLLCLLVVLGIAAAENVFVKTQNGVVKGFTTDATRQFLGIPFAQPPLAALRWTAPVPSQAWSGVYDATYYRSACMQVPNAQPNITHVSEDCLYLNVMTPLNATPNSGLAVMFWIHGGSFLSGSGQLYDGSDLIKAGNVVFVSINYRLGPLGFLALPALANQGSSTGNYGLQDQRLALQWVRDNIAAFGGDPNQVTIFGESAGAISVCSHLAAPLSAGLFRGALMESGFCKLFTLPVSESMGANISTTVGCSSNAAGQLACLRAVPAETLIDANRFSYWSPTIDGVEFTANPISYLANGTFNRVPLLLGTNRNEEGFFLCQQYANLTADFYATSIKQIFGESFGSTLMDYYPASAYNSPVEALVDLYTDYEFVCPTHHAAEAVANSSIPVFMYSFSHAPSTEQNPCFGVSHTYELPFIFSNLLKFVNTTFTPAEQQLASAMLQFWTSFAKNLVPTGAVPWNQFVPSSGNEQNVLLNLTISTEVGYRSKYCAVWSEIDDVSAF
eukprot:TRINITY_DN23481_c0_g1_i1.p1 TRINITY_DN23481_c0_g1~~TRINITY_DN23481_c0_g1_i1.p1  ORF type:complete len:505 (+),score=136.16 TRINITY_DN23481_c0_g1_i1:37-1551(+)